MTSRPTTEGLTLTLELSPGQLEQLTQRVAQLLADKRDQGFLDVAGAAAYLSLSRTAVYHLVERGKLPHHRAGGRLLFDKRQLRQWVEAQR